MNRLTRALQASAGFAFYSIQDAFAPRCLSAIVGCEGAREKVGSLDCLRHLDLLCSFVLHEFRVGRLLGAPRNGRP